LILLVLVVRGYSYPFFIEHGLKHCTIYTSVFDELLSLDIYLLISCISSVLVDDSNYHSQDTRQFYPTLSTRIMEFQSRYIKNQAIVIITPGLVIRLGSDHNQKSTDRQGSCYNTPVSFRAHQVSVSEE